MHFLDRALYSKINHFSFLKTEFQFGIFQLQAPGNPAAHHWK